MGLIEDAKRLAANEPIIHSKLTSEDECACCAGLRGDHDSDCPWLSMPRIVAALEAAQALVKAQERDQGCTECVRFPGPPPNSYQEMGDHYTSCRWQALAQALEDDA